MSSLNIDEEQRWVPTHVQVTVLRARGLRAKGKQGTSDVYTIIQVGKEKYSTCVAEKTTEPEWLEECSFELQPGLLEHGGRDAYPPGSCDLTLTVMHRALIGLDVFLGQVVIPLDKAFRDRICMKNEWYKLHSKSGKKEKERGELQVTVQFTRHNLTASMYDLSMKDKPLSAFEKLRERMRGKKRGGADEDSSSAIVSGGYGALVRMRGRLPSDGGGEEDYEDDEGGEARRSKMRSFFLRGRLRKSSDTRSSTSLGSESSESSSRGGSLSPTAGISVVVSDLSNSPSNSSNLTADNSPEHTVAPSPQVSPVRRVPDDVCDMGILVSHSLIGESDTFVLPSVCVNGNPVDTSPETPLPPPLQSQPFRPQTQLQTAQSEQTKPETQTSTTQPQQTKPQTEPQTVQSADFKRHSGKQPQAKPESKAKLDAKLPALAPSLGLMQKGSGLSLSLQNLSRKTEGQTKGCPVDGRRWSFDKPGDEEKAAIAAALQLAGKIEVEQSAEITGSVGDVDTQSKKKRGLFSHGRDDSAKGPITSKEQTGQAPPPAEGKHRSWFGSKDSHSKPSLLASPLADLSSDTSFPLLPPVPTDSPQGILPRHTNPFSPPPLSSSNPFLSLLKQNPFFQELHSVAALTTTLPALPSVSSPALCHQETLCSGPNLSSHHQNCRVKENKVEIIQRVDRGGPFTEQSPGVAVVDEFEAFVGDRLKSPEVLKTQTRSLHMPHLSQGESASHVSSCFVNTLTGSSTADSSLDCILNPTELGNTILARTTTMGNSEDMPAGSQPQCSGSKSFYKSTNTNITDIYDSAVHEVPLSNQSELSLPQNSSLEFYELHELASPFPALTNLSPCEVKTSLEPKTLESSSDMCLTETHLDILSLVPTSSLEAEDELTKSCIPSSYFGQSCGSLPEACGRPKAFDLRSDGVNQSDVFSALVDGSAYQEGVIDLPINMLNHPISKDTEKLASTEVVKSRDSFCRELGSDDTLEPSIITTDFPSQEPNCLSTMSSQVALSNLNQDPGTKEKMGHGKESINEGRSDLDSPLSVHTATDLPMTESPSTSVTDFGLIPEFGQLGMEKEEPDMSTEPVENVLQSEPKSVPEDKSDSDDVTLEGDSSLNGSLICIMTSSPGVSKELHSRDELEQQKLSVPTTEPMQVLSRMRCEDTLPNSFCEDVESEMNHVINRDKSTLFPRDPWVTSANISSAGAAEEAAVKPNSALSPGSLLFQSFYVSAESEHYLTCGSQQVSPSQSSQLSQEPISQYHPLQKVTPIYERSQEVVPDSVSSSEDMLNVGPSRVMMSECEAVSETLPESDNTSELLQKVSPNSDGMQKAMSTDAQSEEALLNCEPLPCLASRNDPSHKFTSNSEEVLVKTDCDTSPSHNFSTATHIDEAYIHNEPSVCDSELTSTISQDLVISDIFTPKCVEKHSGLTTVPKHTPYRSLLPADSMEDWTDAERVPQPEETSDAVDETRPVASVPPQVDGLSSDGFKQPSAQQSLSESGSVDTAGRAFRDDLTLNLPSLLNSSPLASSTPSLAAETNAPFTLFPFSNVSTAPVKPSPGAALVAASFSRAQPAVAASHAPFPQETQQTDHQHSSPHPVKPLTPPEEKRSEGRSVLEKLKSTIHPGRASHHGEQEADKNKTLVEGGGSYYHLNHSELVSLLLQRDAELRRERAEFERRGVLLEKREAELKKMKFMIRDLEDYIDTLLVRIMEQKPTLLQVRTKLK